MRLTKEQASVLATRNEVTTDDGITFRFSSDGDIDTCINDYECYGKVEPIGRHEYGNHTRPEGYDGMAMIVDTYQGTPFWWQPPADLRDKWYTDSELRNNLKGTVQELLSFGFCVFTITASEKCKCCGQDKELSRTSLHGMEPIMGDSDIADTLFDMAHDLELQS